MRSRRFLLVAGVLVALNTALWITPQGLALRQMALPQLFGKNLMRADLLEANGQEWRIDRGTITSVAPGLLTLKEADGRVQAIAVSGSTPVSFNGKSLSVSSLARGWRVLVTWPANGAADAVKVESKGKGGGGRGPHGR